MLLNWYPWNVRSSVVARHYGSWWVFPFTRIPVPRALGIDTVTQWSHFSAFWTAVSILGFTEIWTLPVHTGAKLLDFFHYANLYTACESRLLYGYTNLGHTQPWSTEFLKRDSKYREKIHGKMTVKVLLLMLVNGDEILFRFSALANSAWNIFRFPTKYWQATMFRGW